MTSSDIDRAAPLPPRSDRHGPGERGRPARLPTGDPGLDRLTQGGLLRAGLNVFVGLAGAGKSILAHQIGAQHIRDGGTVLYLTALIESHEMLIAQARTMRFFDPAALSHAFYYASLFPALQRGGLDAMTAELRRLLGERNPSLVILDGLQALKLAASSELDFQRFMHDLETQASVAGTTTLVITHPRGPTPDEPILTPDDPTYTLADSVIALRTEKVTLRSVRWLSVLKLRGVDHLAGWHSFVIGQDGIKTFPRLEALVAREGVPSHTPGGGRCGFAIEGLDAMLRGGVGSGSATLVVGTPGSGKTLLCLSFLIEGTTREEPGVFFGFHGTPDRLLAKADGVGLPLRRAVESGQVRLHWQPPSELLADEVAERMLAAVAGGASRRLVIDTVDDLRRGTIVGGRDLDFLSALFDLLRAQGVTLLVTQDLTRIAGGPFDLPMAEISPIVDHLLYLRHVELRGELRTLLAVLKMRDSGFDRAIRELHIREGGLRIGDGFPEAESLLLGLGHLRTPEPRAPGDR